MKEYYRYVEEYISISRSSLFIHRPNVYYYHILFVLELGMFVEKPLQTRHVAPLKGHIACL